MKTFNITWTADIDPTSETCAYIKQMQLESMTVRLRDLRDRLSVQETLLDTGLLGFASAWALEQHANVLKSWRKEIDLLEKLTA